MYFLAIEITRRRLASIISFLASREAFSPSFICLLIVLQVVERHDGARLQVDQLLLQLLHGGQVARQDRRCRACRRRLPSRPTSGSARWAGRS